MKNPLVKLVDSIGILQNPGDSFVAKITKTNRKVVKAKVGNKKISATQYPNGRIVETRSYIPDDK